MSPTTPQSAALRENQAVAGAASFEAARASIRHRAMDGTDGARASCVIGSAVYNEHNDRVGSVDELLIGEDSSLMAVLSVGGFCGIGATYIEVPCDGLRFGSASDAGDKRVVFVGVTRDSLKMLSAYNYFRSGQGGRRN